MNQERANEIAAKYFPHYPSVGMFYITADEQAFVEADKARMHGGEVWECVRAAAESKPGAMLISTENGKPEAVPAVVVDPVVLATEAVAQAMTELNKTGTAEAAEALEDALVAKSAAAAAAKKAKGKNK